MSLDDTYRRSSTITVHAVVELNAVQLLYVGELHAPADRTARHEGSFGVYSWRSGCR